MITEPDVPFAVVAMGRWGGHELSYGSDVDLLYIHGGGRPDHGMQVATALDELGARGRMVGVVTHVRELADRLPVRFEVRKVGGASTVERVDL